MPPANFTDISYLLEDGQSHKDTKSAVLRHKESEPLKKETPEKRTVIHEVVEHEPDKEVQPFLDHRKETVTVTDDLKKMGVNVSIQEPVFKSEVPVIELPISDEKIENGLHAKITSSLRWLAEFCLYRLRQAHLTLKKIHGRVFRVAAN